MKPKVIKQETPKQDKSHTERLLRLSDEAENGKIVEVTDLSDKALTALFAAKG